MQNLMWPYFEKFLATKHRDNWLSISQIDNCNECKPNKCEHATKLYLDKLKKSIGFIRDEFSRWLQQNKKIVVANPFKLDFKLITEILKKFNLPSICNDDFLKNYTQWIEDIIHDYVNFDSLISSGPNDNEIFNDIGHFTQKILAVNLNRDNKHKLSFSLTKNLIDSVKFEKFSGFDNIECLSARIMRQVLLYDGITDLEDFQALMDFLHKELKIKNGSLNVEAIKWISDTIFFKYRVKASKCFDLLRLQNINTLSPSMLLEFIKNVVSLQSGIPDDFDDANKFITEELNKWGAEERNKFIEKYDLIMDDSNKLYKSKCRYIYPTILQDLARLGFHEITDLLSFAENYTLPDPKDLQYKREVNDFFGILFWALSNSKEELTAELVRKIVRYINEHMKIKLPENIDKYDSGKKLKQMLICDCDCDSNLILSVSSDCLIVMHLEDEVRKFCDKLRAGQIDEAVLKRFTANIEDKCIKFRIKNGSFIRKELLSAISCFIENTMDKYLKDLDEVSLKEAITSFLKLFFTLENIMSKNKLESEIKNATNKIYFTLVEIIKNNVNEYSEQIMSDSTGEYDLQKIIDKYYDISKTFSEAGKMSENGAEETRKNICNAIKNASLAFIENNLKVVHDKIKSGQLGKSNLQDIQGKYYKMLDTLYKNETIAKRIVYEKKESIENSIEQLKNVTVEQSEHQSESKISDLKNESEIPAPIENETKPDENENNVNELKDAQIESQKKTHDNTPILKAKVKMVSDSDNKTNDLESMIKEDIAGIYYENEYHALEKFDVKEKYNKYITKLNEPKILVEKTDLRYIDQKNRLDNIFKVNIVFVCLYWIGQVFKFIFSGFNSKNAIAGIKNPRTKIIFDRLCYNFCSGVNYLGGQSSFSDKMPTIAKSGNNHDQPNLKEGRSDIEH